MQKIGRALISVFDKTGIEEFARGLLELGVEVISTGGTAKFLREKGIPIKEVSEVTKFPEILEGRVKTLHPAIHAAVLARRDKPSHMKTLAEHGISPIDLLVVNLYPFAETVARHDVKLEDAIENIDIGGPALLRAAAKNYHAVGVVASPNEYGEVLSELKATGGLSHQTRWRLAAEAFALTAAYDMAVQDYLEKTRQREAGRTHPFPPLLQLVHERARDVRYGENPHQLAALYKETQAWGIASAKQLQGKDLSYNNLVDLDAALGLITEFEEPTAVVIKHANPCGVACAGNLLEAYRRARACDPVSAYGGVIAVNRTLDEAAAKEITSAFIEAVVAPAYDLEALEVLSGKKDLRALELPFTGGAGARLQLKQISGGILVQEEDALLFRQEGVKVVTHKKPTEGEMEDLTFAWKAVKHVKSNAIVVAKGKQAVGVGAGQMSRVDSVEIAIRKAGDRTRGAVLASDAFFPFADSIHKAADAGITSIIQPGGSVRDAEVIEAANQRGISMVFTGIRHFRH